MTVTMESQKRLARPLEREPVRELDPEPTSEPTRAAAEQAGSVDRASPGALAKRAFDITVSLLLLTLTSWLIALAWLAATIDTRANGFFTQERVGKHARRFRVIKLRTMRVDQATGSTVTIAGDQRITRLGRFFRRTKIDELPQLINVLKGEMSFVGPRPDVPGYADALEGEDRVVLAVRPGITGPATLKYRNEESLLSQAEDPEAYNREVIFPDKVRLNREYVRGWSFRKDLHYLKQTILG